MDFTHGLALGIALGVVLGNLLAGRPAQGGVRGEAPKGPVSPPQGGTAVVRLRPGGDVERN